MTYRISIVAVIIILVAVEPVSARELPTPPGFPIVLSGERAQVYTVYNLNADCSSAGKKINARVLEKPRNGVAEIITEQGFSSYGKDDQEYKCNEKPSEVVNVYYQSRNDFKGKDHFAIEVFFSNGSYRKKIFNVDVR